MRIKIAESRQMISWKQYISTELFEAARRFRADTAVPPHVTAWRSEPQIYAPHTNRSRRRRARAATPRQLRDSPSIRGDPAARWRRRRHPCLHGGYGGWRSFRVTVYCLPSMVRKGFTRKKSVEVTTETMINYITIWDWDSQLVYASPQKIQMGFWSCLI